MHFGFRPQETCYFTGTDSDSGPILAFLLGAAAPKDPTNAFGMESDQYYVPKMHCGKSGIIQRKNGPESEITGFHSKWVVARVKWGPRSVQ